jgi:choline dehydrogenase-like flavoprotein
MGHYLVDQIYGAGLVASVPEARNGNTSKALMQGGALVPRFRNIKTTAKNFLRGYALNVYSGTGPMDPKHFAAYGRALQEKLDAYDGSGFSIGIMGEVLAHYDHHVAIDRNTVDAWNIPVLHINTRYTDNEFNMARDAVDTASELVQEAGFEILCRNDEPNPPGYSIHELGTCRMGNDPKTSILNPWCQSHDIKNLFVVDGASFVSGGWQNPTMTILALSMRASEHLAEEARRGNLS